MPVIKLNTVVLPAPFGPIMLMISPGMIRKLTSCTAARPPNLLVTSRSSRRGTPVHALFSARLSTCSALITDLLQYSLILFAAHHSMASTRSFDTYLRFKTRTARYNRQRIRRRGLLFPAFVQLAFAPRAGNQALRAEDHDHDQDHAKDQVADIAEGKTRNVLHNEGVNRIDERGGVSRYGIELAQDQHIEPIDGQRSDNHARNTAQASDHDHRQVDDRVAVTEDIGRDNPKFRPMIRAREAREKGSHAKGEQLGIAQVDARRCRGNLILANRHPGAPEPRVSQANCRKDRHANQRENQVIVGHGSGHRPGDAREAGRLDTNQAVRSIGNLAQIQSDNWHDFTKTKRDNRQIVTTQA